jgi:hypothetical protein
MEEYLQRNIEEIKPQMLQEARRLNLPLPRRSQLDMVKGKARNIGYQTGYGIGHLDGYVEGSKDADYQRKTINLSTIKRIDYSDDRKVRRVHACCQDMSCEDHQTDKVVEHQFFYGRDAVRQPADPVPGHALAYTNGRTAGYSQGHAKGRAVGKAEAIAAASEKTDRESELANVESELIGFHKAMLMCCTEGKNPDLPRGRGEEASPYYWGRALAIIYRKHKP